MTFDLRRVRTSGGDVAYADLGDGPVVLLLHGFPQSSFVWRDLAPLLASRFRVIAPDLLGAGDSDKPVDAPLSLDAQTGYVRELLDALGVERFAAVGHGFGGGIAQRLALDGADVDALVLIDSIAFDAWPSQAIGQAQRTPPEDQTEALVRTAMLAAFRAGTAHRARLTEEVLGRYLRPFAGTDGAAAFFRFAHALDGQGLTGREADLGKLEIPVLIFWGEDDPFLPVGVAERLNAAIPSSTLGLVPGCGHFLVDDAVETIGPMIHEYLRARYLRAPHGHTDPTGAVMIQLERRPPWLDLDDDEEDDRPDAQDEEDA